MTVDCYLNKEFGPLRHHFIFDLPPMSLIDVVESFDEEDDKADDFRFPVIVDTEYRPYGNLPKGMITNQIAGITKGSAMMIDHPSSIIPKDKRHQTASVTENLYTDFLLGQTPGVEIKLCDVANRDGTPVFPGGVIEPGEMIYWDEFVDCPKAIAVQYCYFGTAENPAIWKHSSVEYRTAKLQMRKGGWKDPSGYVQAYKQGRRLETSSTKDNGHRTMVEDYIDVGKAMVITLPSGEVEVYRLMHMIFDTSGMENSYLDLLLSGNIAVNIKKTFNKDEMSNMDRTYLLRPDDFREYGLGDLRIYEALVARHRMFHEFLMTLGYDVKHKLPKMSREIYVHEAPTTGRHAANLIGLSIQKAMGECSVHFDVTGKNPELLVIGAPEIYRDSNMTTEICLIGKVHGGRCRNARPLVTRLQGLICDIDLAGAYGRSMANIPFCIGEPVIIQAGASFTIPEFNAEFDGELVDLCWTARMNFKFNKPGIFQNYFGTYTKTAELAGGGDDEYGCFDYEKGYVKVFSREGDNCMLNSDGFEYIKNAGAQGKEFIKTARITSYAVHRKSDRCSSFGEMVASIKAGNRHAWCSCTMGDLIVNDLLMIRELMKRQHGKKSSYEVAAKKVVNCCYGSSASVHFSTANSIMANNLTARVRHVIWGTETALNCVNSITDGGGFDPLDVLITKPKRKYNFSDFTMEGRPPADGRQFTFGPVGGAEELVVGDDGEVIVDNDHFNEFYMDHLRRTFPWMSAIHEPTVMVYLDENNERQTHVEKGAFSFEIKRWYAGGASFSGSAHYLFSNDGYEVTDYKFRGHESERPYYSIEAGPNPFADKQNPALQLLRGLLADPTKVPVTDYYWKTKLIKLGAHQQAPKRMDLKGLAIGDDEIAIGCVHHLSVGTFTYLSPAQYEKFDKSNESAKKRRGWGFERYFSFEEDGKTFIDNDRMRRVIYEVIQRGGVDITKEDLGITKREYERLSVLNRPGFAGFKALDAPGIKVTSVEHGVLAVTAVEKPAISRRRGGKSVVRAA